MSRKPVQIATNSSEYNGTEHLFALCDDGTIWCLTMNRRQFGWERMPEMPQPAPEDQDTDHGTPS